MREVPSTALGYNGVKFWKVLRYIYYEILLFPLYYNFNQRTLCRFLFLLSISNIYVNFNKIYFVLHVQKLISRCIIVEFHSYLCITISGFRQVRVNHVH